MHLTNYAINKDSDEFICNEDATKTNVGHKRTIKSIFEHIDNNKKNETDPNSK